jgi:hypothetical protein
MTLEFLRRTDISELFPSPALSKSLSRSLEPSEQRTD